MERERLARQLFFRRITTLVAVDREERGYIGDARGWSRRRCHARILRLQVRQNTRQFTESARCSCPLAKCISTRWTSTYLSLIGCSRRSFRSGQSYPSSRSTPLGPTTRSIGSATPWPYDYPASKTPPGKWTKSTSGCRDLPPSYRLPSLSHSRRGHRVRATLGSGPSTSGSRARTRPSIASSIQVRQRVIWHTSSLPC